MNAAHHNHHRKRITHSHANRESLSTLFPSIMEQAQQPGDDCIIEVRMPHDASAEVSFSADALEMLNTELFMFVVSRVMRAWDTNKRAPRSLVIGVSVKVS